MIKQNIQQEGMEADFCYTGKNCRQRGWTRYGFFNEPTAGLDPKERVRFRNLIEELGKSSIVVLSTHIVSDQEELSG